MGTRLDPTARALHREETFSPQGEAGPSCTTTSSGRRVGVRPCHQSELVGASRVRLDACDIYALPKPCVAVFAGRGYLGGHAAAAPHTHSRVHRRRRGPSRGSGRSCRPDLAIYSVPHCGCGVRLMTTRSDGIASEPPQLMTNGAVSASRGISALSLIH